MGWWRRSKEKANNRALFIRCACKTRSFFPPFCRPSSFYPSPAFLPSPSLLCFILYSLSVYIRNVAFDRPFVVGSLPFRREIDLHPRIIGRNYWELLDINWFSGEVLRGKKVGEEVNEDRFEHFIIRVEETGKPDRFSTELEERTGVRKKREEKLRRVAAWYSSTTT